MTHRGRYYVIDKRAGWDCKLAEHDTLQSAQSFAEYVSDNEGTSLHIRDTWTDTLAMVVTPNTSRGAN